MATAPHGNLWDNPLGTDGFEFVEYAAPDPQAMGRLFEQMGFTAVARHRAKNVLLYRQGDVNFIVNAEPQLVRAVVRARARPEHLRDRVSREGRREGVRAMRLATARGASRRIPARWSSTFRRSRASAIR